MRQVLTLAAVIVAVTTIWALGEPTVQRTLNIGANAQHNRCVRDQACYRRCRNDMRKPSRACCRLCRG